MGTARFRHSATLLANGKVLIACGDASGIVTALKGTEIANYRGIDLAPPALELAKRNLEALPCAVELDEADFVQAMRTGSGPAGVRPPPGPVPPPRPAPPRPARG